MAVHVCGADDVLLRVRGEYLEMPGLRLTQAQAQRLWGLDAFASESVIKALVDARFLRRAPDGTFVRVASGSPACDATLVSVSASGQALKRGFV